MTNEPTNADRAACAKDALAVFTVATFTGGHPDRMDRDDLECATGDLIADLLHYAVQQGFDAGGITQRACGHFGWELLDEACLGLPRHDDAIVSELVAALDYLIEQTVDMDLKHGIGLSEGEEEARTKALAAIAQATDATPAHQQAAKRNDKEE
ncbi:MAG TPA: hypothetical protein VMV10_27595 [Pirellulales bacterium]|nr:hypothetical protein [Pirellulales bacterium]